MSWLMLLLFLVGGCQTTAETVEKAPKQELKVIQIEPPVQQEPQDYGSKQPSPELKVIQTMKPVLCGPSSQILTRLIETHNEAPIAIWKDGNYGYKVMVMVNEESGTATVIEWPNSELACFISIGQEAKVVGPALKPKVESSHVFWKKRLD